MDVSRMAETASTRLGDAADPEKAGPMAAYMKTDMPFHGVQKADRARITRDIVREFPPESIDEYGDAVRALWILPHREEKYVAIAYARGFSQFVISESLDLYRSLVVEGAWWDFVDEIAAHLIGAVLLDERKDATPVVRRWVGDEDMWLRRTSIICQLRHKNQTDTDLLADACVHNMADTDFFIRKAIGWSLREYAKTDPEWVRVFVKDHRREMSGLSIREATKHL